MNINIIEENKSNFDFFNIKIEGIKKKVIQIRFKPYVPNKESVCKNERLSEKE